MKVSQVSLMVDDPIAAFKFYTETLGFKEKLYMPEHNLAMVVSPEEPDGTAVLLEPSDNPIVKPFRSGLREQGLPVIVFGVLDVQQEYERLVGLGVEFTVGPTKVDWGTFATFDDTCGNYIMMAQV